MKILITCLIVFAGMVPGKAQQTTAPTDTASAITCGNMVFTVPKGWIVQADGENFAVFLPLLNNDRQRWVNMIVFKGGSSSGHLELDFNSSWQTILGRYVKYQEPYLIKEKSIKGYDIIRGGTNIRKGEEAPLYAHLWVAKVKDKLETILVLANNNNDFDISINKHIKPFWAKLKFNNLPESTSANQTLTGTGIQGIYSGLQSGMRLGGGIAKDITFLIVYNDGKIKRTSLLPEEGFVRFDREVDRELNAPYWGEYDLKKGTVTFDITGQPRTLGFAYKPPKIIYNEYAFTKMAPVNGLTLSGTYSAEDTKEAIAAFGHEPTITFYKDGRFEDNTALYYVRSYDAMFQHPGKGKYVIQQFTIELVYDDGRGSASFPLVTWDALNQSSIQIGANVMVKK